MNIFLVFNIFPYLFNFIQINFSFYYFFYRIVIGNLKGYSSFHILEHFAFVSHFFLPLLLNVFPTSIFEYYVSKLQLELEFLTVN